MDDQSHEFVAPRRHAAWMAALFVVLLLCWYLPPFAARQDALLRAFAPLLTVKSTIEKYYVEAVDEDDLIEGAIRGMVHQLDPYSGYLAPAEYPLFQERSEGNYVGIGIQWRIDDETGRVVVSSPTAFSPAFESGVRVGDVVIDVAGMPVDQRRATDSMQRLLGVEGSMAHFVVERPPDGRRIEFAVRRARIPVQSITGWRRHEDGSWIYLLDDEPSIAYVRIREFWANTVEQFDQALAGIREADARGLILDLRFNPGGDLQACLAITDRFISDGTLLVTRTRREVHQEVSASSADDLPAWPVAVLINGGSASGAEILAGVLQDHGRARVFGERSFGKGSVQKVRPVHDGARALRLTEAYYYLPSGRCLHRRPGDDASVEWGIRPDETIVLDDQQHVLLVEALTRSMVIPDPDGAAPAPPDDAQLSAARAWLRQRIAAGPGA